MKLFGKHGWFWECVYNWIEPYLKHEDFEDRVSFQMWERGPVTLSCRHDHTDGNRLCWETFEINILGRDIVHFSRFPHPEN